MKKLQVWICTICIMNFSILFAQNPSKVSPCFHDELIQAQNKLTPQYQTALDNTYEAMLSKQRLLTRDNRIYTINVVFHVVYKNDAENISDQRIKDQIAIINESYRRKNADSVKTRNVFRPVAGDARIEFRLDRIIRIKTTTLFKPNLLSPTNQIPNSVKKGAEGGSNAVDPDKFLNVWACKIEPLELLGLQVGIILGFAYPPTGLANWPEGSAAPSKELEGVVLDYRTIGKGDTAQVIDAPGSGLLRLKGKAMVHEVGHYLGLRHIWGDGSLLGTSCNGEDGIADTPKASGQSQFDCDTTKNTCVDSGVDFPDMIENYMDYSNEDCQNMFTAGQINIMRNVLEGPRKLLVDNTNANNENTVFKTLISPNPTSEFLNFNWSENAACDVTIYDVLGRSRKQIKNIKESQVIDLQDFTHGLYFLNINSQGKNQVLKIVIR
jgi:Pregnancy-associated plasma protein-A/Secretion system C-terminal sorting domain